MEKFFIRSLIAVTGIFGTAVGLKAFRFFREELDKFIDMCEEDIDIYQNRKKKIKELEELVEED